MKIVVLSLLKPSSEKESIRLYLWVEDCRFDILVIGVEIFSEIFCGVAGAFYHEIFCV